MTMKSTQRAKSLKAGGILLLTQWWRWSRRSSDN